MVAADAIDFDLMPGEILAVIGDNGAALALMEGLRQRGLWVPAIRPPTVPPVTARLRVSLTLNASAEDVVRLAATLERLWPDL